jgi:hypothetical protein
MGGPEGEDSYCKDCCPYKAEHILDSMKVIRGYSVTDATKLAKRIVELEAQLKRATDALTALRGSSSPPDTP